MPRLNFAARFWFTVLLAVAVGIPVWQYPARTALGWPDWGALLLFGLGAAVAHLFPIKTEGTTSYRLTNIFLVAAAIVMPLMLLPALVVLALLPGALVGRHRGNAALRLLVNIPPTLVAVELAALWIAAFREVAPLHGPGAALGLGVAGLAVTLGQNVLLGVGMALHFRLPLLRTDPLHPLALQADAVFAILGIAVAALWWVEPIVLTLVLPLLILVHRLTRTAQLAKLAQVDTKTGLHNARHFEEALTEELDRAARLGRPLAVLFADLDHFKEVNDRHGHDAGDIALRHFGALFATNLRGSDVVARFGGEEFVALLSGTDTAEALYLAERVRSATELTACILPDGTALRRTVSIGVAVFPQDGTTAATLLKAADGALYRAKVTRNAVARVGSLPSVPRLATVAHREEPEVTAGPPRRATVILWSVVALGFIAFVLSLPSLLTVNDWQLLLTLVALSVAAEFVTIQVFENEGQRFSFTFSMVAQLATVAALPAGAPLVAAVAALAHVLQRRQWRRGAGRALFNIASPVLAAGVAAGAYATIDPLIAVYAWLDLPAVIVATVLFYLINNGTVMLAMSSHLRRPLMKAISELRWAAPATILLGLTGAFLGARYAQLGLLNAFIFVLPLLVMRYTLGFAARKSAEALATLRAAKAEAEGAHEEKEQTLRQLIDVVAAIIDARDQAVSGHSARVATYAIALAEELDLSARDRAYLHTAGLLHDLGKIAVPESILHKPAKLTTEEFAVVKEHAALGERILAEVRPLAEVARMVGDHHERFDGTGYPAGEAGAMISLGGRIVAVADTLDSILSDRPYSKGKPLSWALEEFERCSGSHFDPEVVSALHRLVAKRGAAFFQQSSTVVADPEGTDAATTAEMLLPFPIRNESPLTFARN